MEKKPTPLSASRSPFDAVSLGPALRHRAESILRQQELAPEADPAPPTADTTTNIVHELRVHQIQLEMQNEELRRAHADLDASRARYFDLYDLAPVGYCTLNRTGLILQANLYVATLLGLARNALAGQRLSRFVAKDDTDNFHLLSNQLITSPDQHSRELRLTKSDGTLCWVQLSAISSRGPDQEAVFRVVITDVTELKQAEAALQEARKHESLGVLAGGIAHDFNNLLTGILGHASLASLDLPNDSPGQLNLLTIRQNSLRAAELCKQMLAYAGQEHLVVQSQSPNHLVETASPQLTQAIKNQSLLRFALAEHLPLIRADATHIRQALTNLVTNAAEATGEQPGLITVATGLTPLTQADLDDTVLGSNLPEGHYVFLEVSDTGCGMSAGTQEKIFDPFFTTKFAGRGLGLAAVLGIVRRHKGTIRVNSKPGRGTTITLFFPSVVGGAELGEDHPATPSPWRGQGCVLVVDDKESVRTATAQILESLGFQVVLKDDGREAVAAFRLEPDRFALVLMDLTMPHLDGAHAFTELRRIKPTVQVVLMSGYKERDAVAGFIGQGLAGFLQKPFLIETVSATLKRVLTANPA